MIQQLKENKILVIGSFLFMILVCIFLYQDNWIIPLIPFALLAIYTAVFHTEFLFLSLFLLTPLSINIEEYTDSFGLFLPTEPLLFWNDVVGSFSAI
jgi:putative inorganic carbon (hco3(-)) transporter